MRTRLAVTLADFIKISDIKEENDMKRIVYSTEKAENTFAAGLYYKDQLVGYLYQLFNARGLPLAICTTDATEAKVWSTKQGVVRAISRYDYAQEIQLWNTDNSMMRFLAVTDDWLKTHPDFFEFHKAKPAKDCKFLPVEI